MVDVIHQKPHEIPFFVTIRRRGTAVKRGVCNRSVTRGACEFSAWFILLTFSGFMDGAPCPYTAERYTFTFTKLGKRGLVYGYVNGYGEDRADGATGTVCFEFKRASGALLPSGFRPNRYRYRYRYRNRLSHPRSGAR